MRPNSYGWGQDPWEDVFGPILQGSGAAALTQEAYRDTPAIMLFARSGQSDDWCSTLQMPHAWAPGTEVRCHLHCIPMVTPASDQNAYFSYAYAWADDTNALPANSGWTTGNATLVVPASGSKTFKVQRLPLFSSTPGGTLDESCFLVVNVKRLGTDPLDTYSTHKVGGTALANVAVLNVDAHIHLEKQGTTEEGE